MDRKAALLAVSACKNMGKYAEEAETALAYLYPDWEKPAIVDTARFWRCYEMAKTKEYDVLSKVPCKRLDFDDLLLECWMLLRENVSIRTKYEVAFDHVIRRTTGKCRDQNPLGRDAFREEACDAPNENRGLSRPGSREDKSCPGIKPKCRFLTGV